jgi:2-phosphoglycerate kinase
MKATGSQGINSVPDRIKPRLRQIISEEQLERKRAHDRLAQRANRQRTKQYIKYLERQVAELKDKLKGYGDAIQHNAKLQHGNLNLQLQLAMIVDNNGYLNNSMHYVTFPPCMMF